MKANKLFKRMNIIKRWKQARLLREIGAVTLYHMDKNRKFRRTLERDENYYRALVYVFEKYGNESK